MTWIRLIGESGVGKTTVAREIVHRLNGFQIDHSTTESSIIEKNLENISRLSDLKGGAYGSAIYVGPRFSPNPYHNFACLPQWLTNTLDMRLDKSSLSQGETQRLVLIEALTLNPKFLVLDEALSGVSIELESKILFMIKKFCDINLIYITHRASNSFESLFDESLGIV